MVLDRFENWLAKSRRTVYRLCATSALSLLALLLLAQNRMASVWAVIAFVLAFAFLSFWVGHITGTIYPPGYNHRERWGKTKRRWFYMPVISAFFVCFVLFVWLANYDWEAFWFPTGIALLGIFAFSWLVDFFVQRHARQIAAH